MAKAFKLPISARQKIGRYKEKNPTATIQEIADKFGCTYQQARKAINDWDAGALSRPRATKPPKTSKQSPFEGGKGDVSSDKSADQILEEQFLNACELLETATLSVDVRIQLIEKCYNMRKTIQQLRLEKHIKQADATLIGIIVRMFEPEAPDDRIIEIYKEAYAMYKSGNFSKS